MPMRDTLHRLVDALPESELAVAERFLNYLRATADPVLRALIEAPLDDEPETEDERRAMQEAQRSWREEMSGHWRRCGESWDCELDSCPDSQRPMGPPAA
jgi:hypothetical protein